MPTRTPILDSGRTPVYRRPGLDFSVNGFTYAGIMLFMGIAAVNLQASLLFGVFGLMVGVLLSSVSLSKIVVRRLDVRRDLPDQATVGRPALIHYTVRNAKRFWASLSITISELDGVQAFRRQPHAYLLHVAPRTSAVVACEVIPKRRGITTLERHQLSTSFPFGFVKRAAVRRLTEAMLVFPPIARVDRALLLRFKSAEMLGSSLRPKLHGNDEFYGLREFRAGESLRVINWKRSARTGTLVAKEMTHSAPPRIVVVVDTCNADGSSARATQIERSIAQAASLVDASIEAGLAVGLTARSLDAWAVVAPSRGKRHKRELLTLLAKLPDGTAQRQHDGYAALAEAGSVADALTTLVLFTGGPDARTSTARRGAGMIIGCDSAEASAWFIFDDVIDFRHAGPWVEPTPPAAKSRRGARRAHAEVVA